MNGPWPAGVWFLKNLIRESESFESLVLWLGFGHETCLSGMRNLTAGKSHRLLLLVAEMTRPALFVCQCEKLFYFGNFRKRFFFELKPSELFGIETMEHVVGR